MHLPRSYSIVLALTAGFLMSCDSQSDKSVADTSTVQVDEAYLDTDPELAAEMLEPLVHGDAVEIQFGDSSATLQLKSDADGAPVIAMAQSNGTTSYYRKSDASLAKTSLDEFLQGVWVAFARLENGVLFSLDVDTDNRLILLIEEQEQGIRIDIRIQGTPSAEAIDQAALQFQAWQNRSSSSSSAIVVSSSSSIVIVGNSSSSSAYSSSSWTDRSSSSSSIDKPASSSSSTPSLSSSSIAVSSSSSSAQTPSSSSSAAWNGWCAFSNLSTTYFQVSSTTTPGWTLGLYQYSIANTQSTCANGTITYQGDIQKYINVQFSSSAANATMSVTRVDSDGQIIKDAVCSTTLNDGLVPYDSRTSYKTCLTNLLSDVAVQ